MSVNGELDQIKIMVVDDDPSLLRLISLRLQAAGYHVATADSAKQALADLECFTANLVISDVCMDGMDGLALFRQLKKQQPTLPVMLLTAHGNIPDAVDATQEGVFAYLTKPFDSQVLLDKVAQALQQNPQARKDPSSAPWRQNLVSCSPVMESLYQQVQQLANSDIGVVLRGESGSGKELFARALHQASSRSEKPFVAVNCGAIPEALFESELFGHTKGAFSGAVRDHQGLIQAADGGCLFLDEVADMPQAMQVKLLRVLQEREVRAVGALRSQIVDIRVLAASHQDLYQAVEKGDFREDLYYRLSVVELVIPALRERREDIALLAQHFCQAYAQRHKLREKRFSREAMTTLQKAPWPGNVRQLMNVVEQANALAPAQVIANDLVLQALRQQAESLGFSQAREQFERRYLAQILRLTQGNVTQAAKLAERNRTEFYKLLDRHQLSPENFRKAVI